MPFRLAIRASVLLHPFTGTMATLLLVITSPVAAQRPLNLDFERASSFEPSRPWGWSLGWSAFGASTAATFHLDSTVHHAGRWSLELTRPDSADPADSHQLLLQLPASFARGHHLALRFWSRVESVRGEAVVLLESWRNQAVASGDTARLTRPASSTTPLWVRHDLRIDVPTNADVHSVVVTIALAGGGRIWVDDFSLTRDGKPVPSLPPEAAPPSPTERAALRAIATPLTTVDPDAGTGADLAAFARAIDSARIVALGESTHGTREFFLLKHRLLRFLVQREGFRIFAIEANQLATERVNRYVQGGPGTAREAMRVLFRLWNTEEMEALIEWLRSYNLAHPDGMVRFIGYDMQDHRAPADTLRAFLLRVQPALVPLQDALLGEYRGQPSYATPSVDDTIRARWATQAATLWDTVRSHRSQWLSGMTTRKDSVAVEWAVQSANLLRQATSFNVALFSPERDSLMAANLDWYLRTLGDGDRAVVWAHDVHVSRGGDTALSFNGGAQMGAQLSRPVRPRLSGLQPAHLSRLVWRGAQLHGPPANRGGGHPRPGRQYRGRAA